MTFIWIVILFIIILILRYRHRNKDVSFWQDLLRTITLKVTDYFCKGTPTKVVMLYLKTSCFLYGGISLAYPIIRAGLEYDKQNNFGKLFLEFQWDSFGSTSSYIFLTINSLVVIFYFWRYRSDDVAEAIKKILHRTKNIEQQNEQLLSNDRNMDEKLTEILLKLESTSSSIKTLLPKLKESINSLKVKTASEYLDTIWDEVKNHQEDYSLQATILYLQGECARFAKGGDSKSYHERAYNLMKKAEKSDEQILTGVIYEACRSRDYAQADTYSKELRSVAPHNYWGYVSELMQADNLSDAIKTMPEYIDLEHTLATCIMFGGGKNNDLGVDIACYRYHSLDSITIDNFALWIMDLSVATTLFCQSFMIQKNIKEMYTPQCEKLYNLLDKFLIELRKTEIDNPLPDTVFLHAVTGYFGNQDKSWLAAFTGFKPSKDMEEIYNLTYAILLNDAGQYNKAKELLGQYAGDNLVSILNMRFLLAINHNDLPECIEILKCASESKVLIPDHFAHCFFTIVYNLYDSVKEYVCNLHFESEITKTAFALLLDFKNDSNNVDIDFILQHKNDFPYSVVPYMAIILKDKGNLSDAIEILESVSNHKVLDIRTHLLIEFYQYDKSYSQKLYHLLFELRKAGQTDPNMLYLELNISNQIGDNENSLSITSELIKQIPNDINVWVNHILSLYRCEGHESEIIEHKNKFVNTVLSTQATEILFNVYHAINETLFALDLLYDQINRTQDQSLKDFLFTMHINPDVNKLISKEKDSIECGDFVTIFYEGKTKECVVSKGSVYEELIGCKTGDKKEIIIKEPVLVEVQAIHTKYFKLLRDILKDVAENQGSRNIKMFSMDDFDFTNDPIGSLRKMAGKTDDTIAKENALLAQYQNGEMSLFNFINDHECISDTYEKLFGQQFMVCSIPVDFFKHFFEKHEEWKQKEIVLDITSLILLYEFDRRYGLKYEKKFFLPKSITLLIKEQLLNEEKGMPKFISKHIVDKIGYDVIDKDKTILWNKLKSLERWIGANCCIETVEEIINMDFSQNDSQLWRVEVESLLLTRKGMLLLTEDWCFQKLFLNLFPTLSVYQWLTLMGIENANAWGQFMLECGNVGYPILSEYIRSQYDLMSNNNPNNYQTCLKNIKYNPESIVSGIDAAKSLIQGVIEPSKIIGATNMLSIMFSSVTPETCVSLIQRELICSKNDIWHQCLMDALRISHPLTIIK